MFLSCEHNTTYTSTSGFGDTLVAHSVFWSCIQAVACSQFTAICNKFKISAQKNGLSHSTSLLKIGFLHGMFSLRLSRAPSSTNGFGSTAASAAPYANMGRLHPSSTSPSATATTKSSVGLGGGAAESDSDPPQQPQPQHNRSRQKKFLKNFSQLPTATEEVVLQSELRQEGSLKRKTISSVKRGQI